MADAHDGDERAMGWYYYLQDTLTFPFDAYCCAKRAISPLHVRDLVEVFDMAPEDECGREMFVMIRWEKDGLAAPLSQLEASNASDATMTAVEDWKYWVKAGYEF